MPALLVSMLMSDDLPTLERPMTANSGSVSGGQSPVLVLLLTNVALLTRVFCGSGRSKTISGKGCFAAVVVAAAAPAGALLLLLEGDGGVCCSSLLGGAAAPALKRGAGGREVACLRAHRRCGAGSARPPHKRRPTCASRISRCGDARLFLVWWREAQGGLTFNAREALVGLFWMLGPQSVWSVGANARVF